MPVLRFSLEDHYPQDPLPPSAIYVCRQREFVPSPDPYIPRESFIMRASLWLESERMICAAQQLFRNTVFFRDAQPSHPEKASIEVTNRWSGNFQTCTRVMEFVKQGTFEQSEKARP
jgi:hypothetical protein